MINYTIWKLTKIETLEEFLEVLKKNKSNSEVSGKARGELVLKREFLEITNFDLNTIQEEVIEGRSIRYLYFRANAQKPKLNDTKDKYEPCDWVEKVLGYEHNGNVHIVICASLNNAQNFIKKVFGNEEEWGFIESDEYITEDMLYWFFYRLREKSEELILQNPILRLNGIVSYLGRTDDKVNVVRGVGVRVSALLGTLGMLIGDESLRALRPSLQYGDHEMLIELGIGNVGRIYQQVYKGNLQISQDEDAELLNVRLMLLVCKFVLPGLLEGYEADKKKNVWSLYMKQNFLLVIGNEMNEKIERKKIQIAQEIKDYEILNGNDDYEDDEEFSDLEERDK